MRLAIIYIFLILSFGLNAQVLTDFNATATVFFVRGTAPDYTIQALINNTTGQYSASDVQVGDVLYMSEGSSCVRFQVLSVTVVGSSISATVRDIDGITSAFPMGIGMICRETANFSFPLHVDGISDDLLSCVRTHFTELVDQITVTGVPGADTDSIYFDSAGVVSLATRGDTVILPIGGGVGIDTDEQNLSRSGDSILIERGTGVDLADLRDNTDTSGYNLDFRVSNDTIFVRDGNSELFAVLPAGVVDTDTDSIFVDSAGVKTYLVQRGGTIYVSGDEVNDADADATNEIQTLTKSNDTIYLSNGGFVIDADTDTNTDTDTIYFQFGSTIIRKVRNDTVNIPVAIDTTFASNDTIFFVSNGDTSIVILDVPGDNWGNQVVVSDATLTGNGTVSNPLSVVFPVDQVDDADADPTNEIQLLSKSNDTIYLSNGGGFVIDTDTDTNTDEQNLTLVADSLKIERGTGVELSKYLDNTDTSGYNGTLTVANDSVYITDGNGTLKAALPLDLVFDGDSSVTNELQDITSAAITGGLPDDDVTYELSLTNSDVTVSITDRVADSDSDPANEIQDLSIVTDSLLITNGAGVSLLPYKDNTDTSGYNLTFQKIGDSLFITDGSGTLSVYIPDSIGGFVLPTDSITFNNNETGPDEGELNWDQTIGFPVFGGVGGISIKLGQDAMWLCENQTGSPITKGAVVGVVGALGNSGKFLIAPFRADGNTDNDYLLGIAAEDIPSGSDGYVMHQGKIRQIDLTAYPQGAILYASPTVAGQLTTIEPANGFQKFPIAFVVDSSANGTLGVRVKTGEALRDLHDVDVSSAADGDLIYYDATAGYWKTKQDSVIDADADPSNEIQTLSWGAGTNGQDEISLNNGGGTITITDDWGNQVVYTDEDVDGTGTLTGDGTVGSPLKIAQQGATSGEVLKWSNTGQTWLPALDQINDADSVPTNELQDLQIAANILSLTLSDSTVDLSGYLDNTDSQQLLWSEATRTLSLDNSASVVIADNVNDADSDPSNEIQSLTWASGAQGSDIITLSSGGGSVTIADSWGSQSVYSDSTLTGSGVGPSNPLKIAQQGATLNQVLKWNGATWTPDDDTDEQGLSLVQLSTNIYSIDIDNTSDDFVIQGDNGITLSAPIPGVDQLKISGPGQGNGIGIYANDLFVDSENLTEAGTLGSGDFFVIDDSSVGSGSAQLTTRKISPANLNLSLMNNDAGFITSEVDGSTTNEVQSFNFAALANGEQISLTLSGDKFELIEGTNITLSRNIDAITINATGDGTGTDDQQITEFEIVSNNLNLTLEGDATNQKTVDLSPYLDNTDSQGFTGDDNGTTFTFDLSGTANDISLTEGTNVTMTRSGTNVTINATGDGNGVYDGNGTIPANTTSTIAGGDWNLVAESPSNVTVLRLLEPNSGTFDRSGIELYKDDDATSYIEFKNEDVLSSQIFLTPFEDLFINNTSGSVIIANNSATHLQVNQDGTIDLPDYGGGTITGTPAYYLAVDASGNVIEATPATGTDDQTIDVFQLSGTDLNLSLESDNQPTKTVSLASLSDVYTSSQGIKETSKDFKLGEDAASSTAFITSDRFLNFGSSTTNSLVLNNETSATSGTFAPLTIKSVTSGAGAVSAIKFVAGTGSYSTGYIQWAEPILDEQGFTFVGGHVRMGDYVSVIPPTELILTTRNPDNEIAKLNVNQIGVPVSTYTASEAGSISINFASDGRHIAEVDCSGVTSAFTANVTGEGTMTTNFAAIYNVRFHSVGASNITVTLDAGDTWYNEKGDVITTLTLTANEDKIMTFYTKDGINFYTME